MLRNDMFCHTGSYHSPHINQQYYHAIIIAIVMTAMENVNSDTSIECKCA